MFSLSRTNFLMWKYTPTLHPSHHLPPWLEDDHDTVDVVQSYNMLPKCQYLPCLSRLVLSVCLSVSHVYSYFFIVIYLDDPQLNKCCITPFLCTSFLLKYMVSQDGKKWLQYVWWIWCWVITFFILNGYVFHDISCQCKQKDLIQETSLWLHKAWWCL